MTIIPVLGRLKREGQSTETILGLHVGLEASMGRMRSCLGGEGGLDFSQRVAVGSAPQVRRQGSSRGHPPCLKFMERPLRA